MDWNAIERDVRHFLLRLTCYHINLIIWPLPDDLEEMLAEFPGHEDPHFTEAMRRMLIYILAHMPYEEDSFRRRYFHPRSLPSLGEELLEDFNPVAFIEFCFYVGHAVAYAYRNGYDRKAPRRFFDISLVILRTAHSKGLFTNDSWVKLESAAFDLLQMVSKEFHKSSDSDDPPSPSNEPMQV